MFNSWAQKINQGLFADQEEYKLLRLKSKLIDAFYNWLKIKLPDEIFINITESYPDLLKLVFQELDGEDEILENATNCIIEMILLAKRKKQFEGLINVVVNKIEKLQARVQEAVDTQDSEKGDQLCEIFVELGRSHVTHIIEGNSTTIPNILLQLLSIPEISK